MKIHHTGKRKNYGKPQFLYCKIQDFYGHQATDGQAATSKVSAACASRCCTSQPQEHCGQLGIPGDEWIPEGRRCSKWIGIQFHDHPIVAEMKQLITIFILVGGVEQQSWFFHLLGIICPNWLIFFPQRGRYTTNQLWVSLMNMATNWWPLFF